MDHALTGIAPETATGHAATAPRPLRRLGALLALLRPRHWLKGTLVLLAPLITATMTSLPHLTALGLTLLTFLTASSAIYVLNDLRDRESDRLHPVKRHRPLASGRVSAPAAIALLVVLAIALIALLITLPLLVRVIIGAYLAVNIWYCLALKHQPLVDVSVVATGFVLRVLAGTIAADLPVQPFLLICVYCACIAVALGKRRHELAGLPTEDGTAARHRAALAAYSVPFLDHVVVVNLVAALGAYVAFLWQVRPPTGAVAAVLTFPFATFTIYRYLQMLMVERSGGDPVDDLLRDRPMRMNLGLWSLILLPILIVSAL